MCHKQTTGQIFTLANVLSECCDQDPPIISPLTTSQVTGVLWFGRAHPLDVIICTISRHVQKEILHDKFLVIASWKSDNGQLIRSAR